MTKEHTTIIQDEQRLATLTSLDLLETSYVEGLDRLTRLVSKITGSPISLVSIVDADRQFFKSRFGLPDDLRETPLSHSFCQHVVTTNEPLVVEDAREVDFLKDNLAIPDLNVIAYLGMPLNTLDGTCLGSFCVIDDKPRKWTPEEIDIIKELAVSVMTEIELTAEAKAHQESKAQLQAVFKHVPLIVYSLDRDGRFTLSEGKGLNAIGRKPGEVVGQSVFDLYKNNPIILKGIKCAYEGQSTQLTTHVSSLTYDAWYEPIWDQDKDEEVIGVVGVARDITASKKAEQSLHRHIFEQSTLNEIAISLSGQTDLAKMMDALAIKINQLFDGQLTSISIVNSEKTKRTIIALHDPMIWPKASTLLNRSFNLRRLQQAMLSTILDEGKALWMHNDSRIQYLRGEVAYLRKTRTVSSLLVIPLHSRAEVIGGITVSFSDPKRTLTQADINLAETIATQAASAIHNARLYTEVQTELNERKVADAKLAHSLTYQETLAKCATDLLVTGENTQNLASALHSLRDGLGVDRVFFGSNHQNSSGQFYIQWSHESTAESVSPVDSAITDKPYFLPPEWLSQMQNPMGLPIPGGSHLGEYHIYFREAGQEYSCYMIPVGIEDQWYGVLGLVKAAPITFWSEELINTLQTAAKMIHSFSDRRKNQEELEQAHQEALGANRLKNQILAKVSHELKTPLGAILGYSELMQMGLYGPTSKKQKDILDEMIDSTDYLNSLVNELLEQARLDASELKLNLSSFKLNEIFAHVQSQVSVLATSKQVALSFMIDPQMSQMHRNDKPRLQQVLMNLVSNAVKFTEKGLVQVNARHIDDRWWCLDVKDTGIGIPEEAQNKIFEPFQQVDGTSSRAKGGTGLGLSITKRLVLLMGGEITLNSVVGKGSTFTVTMPYLVGEENA